MISTNIILPFAGIHAAIPVGFVRETRLDGKFPKGAVADLGGAYGSNTHTHTAAHTHTVAAHTHTVSTGNAYGGDCYDMGTSGGVTNCDHSHGGTTGSTGGEVSGVGTPTLAAMSSLPPYYEVIFIRSMGQNPIPTNAIIMTVEAREATNVALHTDSQGRFLRGAATNQNAGNVGGVAHTHTQSHTHAAQSHSHYANQTSWSGSDGEDGMSGPSLAHGHPHTFYVNNSTQDINAESTTSSSSFPEMLHKTLRHYIATDRLLPLPGDIALLIDGEVPQGWVTCDGANGTPDLTGYYVKNTATGGASVGGSNTHTHTITHNHTGANAHSHVTVQQTEWSGDQGGHNGGGKRGRRSHVHAMNSPTGATLANYNSTVATSTADNNEPEYVKVRFIQMIYTLAGGQFVSSSE